MKKTASDDPYKLFTVEWEGKSLKLKEKQVLSQVFNFLPEIILLVTEDGYVELPDASSLWMTYVRGR